MEEAFRESLKNDPTLLRNFASEINRQAAEVKQREQSELDAALK